MNTNTEVNTEVTNPAADKIEKLLSPFYSRSAENSNSTSGLHRAGSELEKAHQALRAGLLSIGTKGNTLLIPLIEFTDDTDDQTNLYNQLMLSKIATGLTSLDEDFRLLLATDHGQAGYLTAGLKKIAERPESAIEKLGKLSFTQFQTAAAALGLTVTSADSYGTKTGKTVEKSVITITITARALAGGQLEFLETWGIDLLEPNRLLATARTDTTATYTIAKPKGLAIESIPTTTTTV